MQASLIVFIIAKHLNNAACELERLEQAASNKKPETAHNSVVETSSKEIEDGSTKEASSKESSQEAGKESGSEENCKESNQEASKEVKAKKPSTPKKAKSEEAPKEAVKVPERKITLEIIRSECKKVIDEKGRPALAELLASFNATKTSELQEEQFVAVFEKCQTILGAGNEF